MNSFDRVLDALKFKEVDRIPVIPQLTYASALWINKTIRECINDPEKQYKALVFAYKECGYDAIYAGWEGSFNLLANGMGAELKYQDENPPSVQEIPVSNLEKLDEFTNKNIKGGDINFVNFKGIDTNLKLIKKLKDNLNDVPIMSYVPGPFTYVGVINGLTNLMISIIRRPELIKNAMELIYDFVLRFSILKVEAGADFITIADPSSSSSIISPKNFQELGYPFLKRMISDLRAENKNLKVGIHICGNTKPIQNLIESLNPDYFEVDSLVPLDESRKIMGKTCLIGNIPPSDLNQKTKSEIRKLSDQCLNILDDNGFILSSGCEIVYGTPIENIKEMVISSLNHKI